MIKTCVECGKQFELTGAHGNNRKCCSEECSKDRHRKRMRVRARKAAKKKGMMFLKCAGCGDVFPHQGLGRRPKFCHKCRANGGKPKKRIELVRKPKKKEPAKTVMKTCPICGKSFEGFAKRVYCSNECAKVANIRKATERNRVIYSRPRPKKPPKPKAKNDRCMCQRVESCIYGRKLESSGLKFCDYMNIVGHARGGYPDECKDYAPKGR